MQDLSEVLGKLHDIHEPNPIGWWPPAIGWWLLLLLLIIFVVALYYLFVKYKRSDRRLATLALNSVQRDFDIHKDKTKLIKDVSAFLRRVAVLKAPSDSSKLTGIEWLEFLDKLSDSQISNFPNAELLISGPYRAKVEYDADSLFDAIKLWVRQLK